LVVAPSSPWRLRLCATPLQEAERFRRKQIWSQGGRCCCCASRLWLLRNLSCIGGCALYTTPLLGGSAHKAQTHLVTGGGKRSHFTSVKEARQRLLRNSSCSGGSWVIDARAVVEFLLSFLPKWLPLPWKPMARHSMGRLCRINGRSPRRARHRPSAPADRRDSFCPQDRAGHSRFFPSI